MALHFIAESSDGDTHIKTNNISSSSVYYSCILSRFPVKIFPLQNHQSPPNELISDDDHDNNNNNTTKESSQYYVHLPVSFFRQVSWSNCSYLGTCPVIKWKLVNQFSPYLLKDILYYAMHNTNETPSTSSFSSSSDSDEEMVEHLLMERNEISSSSSSSSEFSVTFQEDRSIPVCMHLQRHILETNISEILHRIEKISSLELQSSSSTRPSPYGPDVHPSSNQFNPEAPAPSPSCMSVAEEILLLVTAARILNEALHYIPDDVPCMGFECEGSRRCQDDVEFLLDIYEQEHRKYPESKKPLPVYYGELRHTVLTYRTCFNWKKFVF